MANRERTALVVGGGIGGVTAALALLRVGWQVCVLERSPAAGEVGAGITLFPNALRALDAIGAGQRVRAAGAQLPGGNGALRAPDGRSVVDASGLPAVADLFGFHRADLHAALRHGLPGGVLRTGAEVAGVDTATTGRPRLRLAGGEQVDGDLVVAADGLRSRIRAAMHPGYPGPRYAGYTSWRAVTAHPVPLPGGGETWGRGLRFGVLPLRDGLVYWFAVANRAAGVEDADPMAAVRARFGHWHDPIPALLAATDPEAVLHLDIHDLPTPLPAFHRGRLGLLGDAAHAMTPDVGQGACQAIEDAVTLAAEVGAGDDLESALARYDAQRRPRTQQIVRAARRTGRVAQAEGPVAVRLRSAVLRLTPPAAALRTVARITAWTPPALPAVAP